jgi:hypothetical protein
VESGAGDDKAKDAEPEKPSWTKAAEMKRKRASNILNGMTIHQAKTKFHSLIY